MRKLLLGIVLVATFRASLEAQQKPTLSSLTKSFVTVDSTVVALEHVRVIDGTGAAPEADQTILIENGMIRGIGPSSAVSVPPGAHVLELKGRSVIPGLVGMHDHMFYPAASGEGPVEGAPALYGEMGFSFPRLYLAEGVTSIRTTGSLETYTDLALKKMIDTGKMPGPKINITGPYLEGAGSFTPKSGVRFTVF
jgi:imidazolonepropionase-like amidohydrolase